MYIQRARSSSTGAAAQLKGSVQAVEGPGAAAMRAVQIVCWLLAAIYLLAALGSVVASGEVSTGAVELAVNAPALLVAAPVVVGRVAERK